jgi:PhnB protein
MSESVRIPPVTPHLTVSDAWAAIGFYRRAFDAPEITHVEAKEGKRLLHAALAMNGALVMLCDDFPGFNMGRRKAPGPEGGAGVTIHLNVPGPSERARRGCRHGEGGGGGRDDADGAREYVLGRPLRTTARSLRP